MNSHAASAAVPQLGLAGVLLRYERSPVSSIALQAPGSDRRPARHRGAPQAATSDPQVTRSNRNRSAARSAARRGGRAAGGPARSSAATRRTIPSPRCRRPRRPGHGADQPVAGQSPLHLPSAELRSAVGVQDATGDVTVSAGDSHVDRGDHEPGFHPRVECPADDRIGAQVLDRAAVDLAFGGPALGEVGDP